MPEHATSTKQPRDKANTLVVARPGGCGGHRSPFAVAGSGPFARRRARGGGVVLASLAFVAVATQVLSLFGRTDPGQFQGAVSAEIGWPVAGGLVALVTVTALGLAAGPSTRTEDGR